MHFIHAPHSTDDWEFLIYINKHFSQGWQSVDGKSLDSVADFIFLGSKITAVGDCSHENKRRLLLGRKAMTNLDSILKSRDTTLLTKFHLIKAMVFPVVMYECELDCKKLSAEELVLLNCGVEEDS